MAGDQWSLTLRHMLVAGDIFFKSAIATDVYIGPDGSSPNDDDIGIHRAIFDGIAILSQSAGIRRAFVDMIGLKAVVAFALRVATAECSSRSDGFPVRRAIAIYIIQGAPRDLCKATHGQVCMNPFGSPPKQLGQFHIQGAPERLCGRKGWRRRTEPLKGQSRSSATKSRPIGARCALPSTKIVCPVTASARAR